MSPRKRWMRQPLSWKRGGAVALMVLIGVAAAALVLDADADAELAPVVERLSGSSLDAVGLVERTARSAQIVLLSDVPGQAAPKRVAAESILRLAAGPGLDAVLLEVPASEQPYIDAYLAAGDEDAAALLSRPAAVQEHFGLTRDYLAIYQAVREVNQGRSPSRRVRVVAADAEGWPPPEGAGSQQLAEVYAGRAEHMLARLDRELFSLMPDARVLVFVDGYLTLRNTHGMLRFAGGEGVRVDWLGGMLRNRSGREARTILLDPGAGSGGSAFPTYHGTTLHRPLRRELDESAATSVAGALGEVDDPVLEYSTPGLRLDILPDGHTMAEVADGYIFLRGGR